MFNIIQQLAEMFNGYLLAYKGFAARVLLPYTVCSRAKAACTSMVYTSFLAVVSKYRCYASKAAKLR